MIREKSFKKLCVALDGENLNLNTSLHLSPLEFLESSEDINLAYNFIETLLYLNDTTADNNERHEILEALKILSKNKEMPRSLADSSSFNFFSQNKRRHFAIYQE